MKLVPAQPHTNLSDEELLKRFRHSADNKWLGVLLERYTMLLFGVAMKYLKDRDNAQDAVQHVFLKSLTHLPEGDIINFKGWLYILTRNHCLQVLRDRSYNDVPDELIQQIPSTSDAVEEIRQKEYTLQQMEQAMQELNPEQRQVLNLFYLEKQSYQQIIEATGYTYMQVKSYIQNGKRNLKLQLQRKLGNNNR